MDIVVVYYVTVLRCFRMFQVKHATSLPLKALPDLVEPLSPLEMEAKLGQQSGAVWFFTRKVSMLCHQFLGAERQIVIGFKKRLYCM